MSANFRSDNETPVADAIMEAILEANHGIHLTQVFHVAPAFN